MNYLICLLIAWAIPLQALVLEDLDTTLLKEKQVGYFLGSFDPLHKGHEATVHKVLAEHLVDYVLIYPVWGGDIYKVRTDVAIRLDMLFSVFKDHPNVIVTRMPPKALQEALQLPTTRFIGIVGTDTALYLAPNPETSKVYMTGIPIPEEYALHTWGCCMALPVNSFIVTKRHGDDISCLNGYIRERPILALIHNKQEDSISCTNLKKLLNSNQPIDHLVSPSIASIIDQHHLYR